MRVIKYPLHEGLNSIQQLGTINLKHLDYQGTKLMGWFTSINDFDAEPSTYEVYIALTGEQVPDEYQYVTSTQLNTAGGYYVVHAFD